MPNVSEKKKKLLFLLKILLQKTDGEHALTLPQLLEELESLGVSAERKSIYDDLETLRSVGVPIETKKSKTFQYYIEKRLFSLQELQTLVGAVHCAPFLSEDRAAALEGKLEGLCSMHQASALRLETGVQASAQEGEAPALSAVELLQRAMAENCQVRFRLLEWTLSSSGKPERGVKKGGKPLTVSPWKLSWDKDRCELTAYDGSLRRFRRFRTDQICSPELLPLRREGGESAGGPGGREKAEEKLVLEFPEELLGAVVEYFGPRFTAEPFGKNRLRAAVRAEAGTELFAWLFSQGTEIRLVSPKKLAEQFRERAKAVAKQYKS